MNILLTHFYSSKNNGDAAIVSVMLKQLKETFYNSLITISTMENIKKNEKFEEATQVKSFFSLAIYKSKNSVIRLFTTGYILGVSIVWASFVRWFGYSLDFLLTQELKQLLHAYANSDLVVPVGGGYLQSQKSIQADFACLIKFHSIVIALILNKPVVLYSQTIGPFRSSFQKNIAKFVLNKVNGIFAREDHSVKTLTQIGVESKLIYRTVDAAFLFTSDRKKIMKKELEKIGIINPRMLVGITVRRWLDSQAQDKFESEIAKFANYLVSKQNATVVFIPQVTSKLDNDDDRDINNRISKKIGRLKNVYFLDKEYDHHQLKGIYENLDYLVGTRMHSIILSISSLVPCLAIEYEYKTSGIMKDLGLSNFVIKIEDVTSEKLYLLFEFLQKNKNTYLEELSCSLSSYLTKAQKTKSYLRKIYEEQRNGSIHQKNEILDISQFLSFLWKPKDLVEFFISHPLIALANLKKNLIARQVNLELKNKNEKKVSIIVVTYNALEYIKICLNTLQSTNYNNKEIIVVDNNSNPEVRAYLRLAKKRGLIDTLFFSQENTFFSGGNNLGARIADKKSEYLLLLNSDIEIKNPNWLKILSNNAPARGIISFGKVDIPVIKPDGWCFMIDKKSYQKLGGLNEYYKLNGAITELTAKVLRENLEVKTIANPNNYVYHFGQKSRPKRSKIKVNRMSTEEEFILFGNKQVELLKI